MKNNIPDLPPFYVGQRVVALVDSDAGYFKKGDERIVRGFKFCCQWSIDIGCIVNDKFKWQACTNCETLLSLSGEIRWCRAKLFAPVTEQFQSITQEKVIETETPLVCVN